MNLSFNVIYCHKENLECSHQHKCTSENEIYEYIRMHRNNKKKHLFIRSFLCIMHGRALNSLFLLLNSLLDLLVLFFHCFCIHCDISIGLDSSGNRFSFSSFNLFLLPLNQWQLYGICYTCNKIIHTK